MTRPTVLYPVSYTHLDVYKRQDLVFSAFLGELFSTDQDFDTYLAECRQQLLEAGAQEVIEEANRQFDAFKTGNGS